MIETDTQIRKFIVCDIDDKEDIYHFMLHCTAYSTNWSNLVAVMDWGGANSRFLGLVSVWAARSFDQTALRPSVIKRIRQIDVKIHNTYHKLR